MLKSFRNASNSIVIKVIFGLIIASFCLWGVGDIIKNYSASQSVFSVGKTKMSADTFIREYSQEKQRIRNIGSKPLSEDEMNKLDIKNLVLEKFIQKAVIDETLNKLKIIVPKKTLLNIVSSLPDFQKNGIFDEKLYQTAIQRSGISESGFLMQIRDNVAKMQLFHPIAAGYKVPNIIKNIIAKEYDAKKTLIALTIDVNDQKIDDKISESAFQEFYESNKEIYKTPETREISILVVDYQSIVKDTDVSDEEVNKYYLETKNNYTSTEKRDFERFVFESKDDADKAWNLLNKGVSSEEIIKKLTPNMEIVKDCKAADLPKGFRDEMFGLKIQQSSNVYENSGLFYIYRVVKIESGKKASEAEMKAEIRNNLKSEKMNSPEFYAKIKDIRNKIDDGFGAGKTIDEISKETGMKIVNISNLQNGSENLELNKLIKDEETRTEVLGSIFSTDETQISATIDSKESDSMSYVVFVKKVNVAEIPEFDKIKEKVKKDLIFDRKKKIAQEKISELIKEESFTKLLTNSQTKKFKISVKDIINSKQTSSADLKKAVQKFGDLNIVMNLLSGIKNGTSTYFKSSESKFIVVGIEHVEKKDFISKDFESNVSAYLDNMCANDSAQITLHNFKEKLKIKFDAKLIETITQSNDETTEEN